MSKRKEMLTNDKLAAPSKRPSQSEAGPLLRGEFGEDGRKALSQPRQFSILGYFPLIPTSYGTSTHSPHRLPVLRSGMRPDPALSRARCRYSEDGPPYCCRVRVTPSRNTWTHFSLSLHLSLHSTSLRVVRLDRMFT